MKKILAIALVCAISISMAACTSNSSSSSDLPPSSSEVPSSSSEEIPSDDGAMKFYQEETKKVEDIIMGIIKGDKAYDMVDNIDGKLKAAYDAVKAGLGENYIPSSPIETQQLTEVFGVNADDVEYVIAEGPMISMHVDTFIAIKAKSGKGESVEKALYTYRDRLISDSMQYPMNQPKVESSKVIREGDYVFFSLLGAFYE